MRACVTAVVDCTPEERELDGKRWGRMNTRAEMWSILQYKLCRIMELCTCIPSTSFSPPLSGPADDPSLSPASRQIRFISSSRWLLCRVGRASTHLSPLPPHPAKESHIVIRCGWAAWGDRLTCARGGPTVLESLFP